MIFCSRNDIGKSHFRSSQPEICPILPGSQVFTRRRAYLVGTKTWAKYAAQGLVDPMTLLPIESVGILIMVGINSLSSNEDGWKAFHKFFFGKRFINIKVLVGETSRQLHQMAHMWRGQERKSFVCARYWTVLEFDPRSRRRPVTMNSVLSTTSSEDTLKFVTSHKPCQANVKERK